MTDIVTRFAPSPTGHLHLGHAHSALFGWRTAREAGGRFLLRIEDIDPKRCRPEFERDLMEDLAWLGLTWETPVRRQSDHLDDHRAALGRLRDLGVVYPCFCTRKDIAAEIARAGHAPHGPDGPLYPGTCRHLDDSLRQARMEEGAAYALRLDVAKARGITGPLRWHDRARGWQEATPEILGDVVLARKDTPTSYHLAVTVDDHLQGVTLVTRGEDLFFATHVHRLLQALLRVEPPEYHHHALLTNERGERLAKRDQAKSLRSLRDVGLEPSAVRALAGFPNDL
ncbi:tRNA glutamyl-Q(34) synthetase GluQRS [Azospirillum rugosum]|uniref:Glutamyl-Q tRNA(Asp) synthetase n=1 Tax=Azospirillum rugosum TaxID=416170 RepID=A0ABS4SS72_9PROT|nr:tRNA glutamyl-Q(34) synthetase GluQRS [Azospirillum rugosum]MBP2295411.1 glutamyl-Q tRNA(Asp) synthetase [Azospirillum rugosum]MDQ0528786.1 glutamyl-Q tRNA(Asp) synthetase [Azospirillum rugosum]